jgi:hypothetical protein
MEIHNIQFVSTTTTNKGNKGTGIPGFQEPS